MINEHITQYMNKNLGWISEEVGKKVVDDMKLKMEILRSKAEVELDEKIGLELEDLITKGELKNDAEISEYIEKQLAAEMKKMFDKSMVEVEAVTTACIHELTIKMNKRMDELGDTEQISEFKIRRNVKKIEKELPKMVEAISVNHIREKHSSLIAMVIMQKM